MDSERRKEKKVDGAKKYWWAAAVAVPLAGAVIGVTPSILKKESPSITINQDSHEFKFKQINFIQDEYRQRTGNALPPDIERQLEQALEYVKTGKYDDSVALMRTAAEKAPTPAVFTDLAHALMLAGKPGQAQEFYAKAGAAPAHTGKAPGATLLTAAEILLQKPVEATLADGDTHFFKFTAPSGPRDHLRVRLQNRSTSLGLALALRDAAKSPAGGANGAVAADVSYEFPAAASSTYYVQVNPYYSGGGSYTLTVEPTHSFDAFEPNDTVLTAKDISTGAQIEVNIMDAEDTDFYRFRARSARTTIVVENRSTTLGVAVAVTDADKAPVGGQNGSVAANVRYEFDSKPGAVYHVQISPYYSQTGKYALTVQ